MTKLELNLQNQIQQLTEKIKAGRKVSELRSMIRNREKFLSIIRKSTKRAA